MRRSLRTMFTVLAITGATVGGGAAIASAAGSSGTTSTTTSAAPGTVTHPGAASSSHSRSGRSTSGKSHHCPNM